MDISIEEPRTKVEPGQVIKLGEHVLICASVMDDWPLWSPYLQEGCLFMPYAGPFVPLSEKANEYRLVMVQPEPYIAGYIVDRYQEVHGLDD